LEKGYDVCGIVRRSSTFNTSRIDHIKDKLSLFYGDMLDQPSLISVLAQVRPSMIFHMAAQSHVRVSFDAPETTFDITGKGTLNLLEAVRANNLTKDVRIYNATSSEMFGDVVQVPQNELTRFRPCSPYGVAKVASYHMADVYRKSYGMFICNGILFNHEHYRRGDNFVTQKIAKNVAEIHFGLKNTFALGNIDAKRDWGWAPDYMDAAFKMLQHNTPDDYVVATGETHSVKEFLHEACKCVCIDPETSVTFDKRLHRPSEVNLLLGDASKIRDTLEWSPSVQFKQLVSTMVEHQMSRMFPG